MRNRAGTPLTKPKLRQSWNKYNLYNLSQATVPSYRGRSFFQQKWAAKSLLRNYHGEQVKEGQWTRMFRRTIRAVIPMNPAYLAMNDGSVESAGRGSGLKEVSLNNLEKLSRPSIPFGSMTFAPLERRLDTAIFRAMFASSARQARQFVVHGSVKVNGKIMKYPGYLLNPGDMFQVDPERVMYATGAPKQSSRPKRPVHDADNEEAEQSEQKVQSDVESKAEMAEEEVDIDRAPRDILKDLLAQSKSILAGSKDSLSARKKQDLRAFSSAVKRMLSRSTASTILTDSLEAQFQELQNQLKIQRKNEKQSNPILPFEQKADQDAAQSQSSGDLEVAEEIETDMAVNTISDDEYKQLFQALTQMQENPIDDSKPYATPWVPRDYMSAFAFIPRYLEVNQNICAAVYLRHPVARPGIGEVPSPFPDATGGTAYSWYLRRR